MGWKRFPPAYLRSVLIINVSLKHCVTLSVQRMPPAAAFTLCSFTVELVLIITIVSVGGKLKHVLIVAEDGSVLQMLL